MSRALADRLRGEIEQFRADGVYKKLNHLASPQGARVRMEGHGEVVILSSNNYLGLCDVPEVVAAGKAGLDAFGAGPGSVRFATIEVLERWGMKQEGAFHRDAFQFSVFSKKLESGKGWPPS